jgi:hypothetical protein
MNGSIAGSEQTLNTTKINFTISPKNSLWHECLPFYAALTFMCYYSNDFSSACDMHNLWWCCVVKYRQFFINFPFDLDCNFEAALIFMLYVCHNLWNAFPFFFRPTEKKCSRNNETHFSVSLSSKNSLNGLVCAGFICLFNNKNWNFHWIMIIITHVTERNVKRFVYFILVFDPVENFFDLRWIEWRCEVDGIKINVDCESFFNEKGFWLKLNSFDEFLQIYVI